MTTDNPTIAEQIVSRVEDGSLPPDSCVNCNSRHAQQHLLYAICVRANRQPESRGGGFVGGMILGIPFFFPTSAEETTEIREGNDVVVPVPLRVCDDCWQELDGGLAARVPAFCSQALFVVALLMIVVWIVSKVRGAEISFLYAAAFFGASIPFQVAAELVQSRWPRRIRRYLKKVSDYATLFAAYPNAQVVTKEPTALVADTS